MEEFKNCLINLGYLPYMKDNRDHYQIPFGYQRNHITTTKSLVLQEKEFVYNFWCILNPLNHSDIDNA